METNNLFRFDCLGDEKVICLEINENDLTFILPEKKIIIKEFSKEFSYHMSVNLSKIYWSRLTLCDELMFYSFGKKVKYQTRSLEIVHKYKTFLIRDWQQREKAILQLTDFFRKRNIIHLFKNLE